MAARALMGVLVGMLLVAVPAASAVQAAPPRDEPRTIRAVFAKRSYAPGEQALLTISASVPEATLRLFHAGPEGARPKRPDVMLGTPVTTRRRVELGGTRRLSVSIGPWRSGFYFARLDGPGGYLGFAPLIVRPRSLGASRVAVVLPTHTWQAYNFRDVDRDGIGDTWYADPSIRCVDLSRPYLDRGVPGRRFRGFLRWFEHGSRQADFLSDDDLDRMRSGDELARLYDLVVFASHEEYVTMHVWDVVERFRDLGGNLAFLSANTFYKSIERRGQRICLAGRFRDRGRDEAGLMGVEYVGWWQNRHPGRPYTVRAAKKAAWLFAGTGLRNGDTFGGSYGVEIDSVTKESPRGTIVLADIRGIFGPGRTATMAYYETKRGAKVFAAGAFGFESPQTPDHTLILDNMWAHLMSP